MKEQQRWRRRRNTALRWTLVLLVGWPIGFNLYISWWNTCHDSNRTENDKYSFRIVGGGATIESTSSREFKGRNQRLKYQQQNQPKITCWINAQSPQNATNFACTDPIGIIGEWIYMPNRTFASSVCCGWDQGHFLRNPKQCGTTGPDDFSYYVGKPDLYAQSGGLSCTCSDVHYVDEYVWMAPGLPLSTAVDPYRTCQLLGTRKVLLIGDSTMSQVASTLMNALFLARCQTQVHFLHSDTLINETLGAQNRGFYWTDALEKVSPISSSSSSLNDIVIVTVGAHVYGKENYMRIVEQVIHDMEVIHRTRPNTTFVWKTQQPGGCTRTIFHPSNPQRAGIEFNFFRSKKMHQHDEFYDRDLYLLWRLQQSKGMRYFDMRMLYSRSDAHISSQGQSFTNVWGDKITDCLHMCLPGPLDVFVALFQQLLETIA